MRLASGICDRLNSVVASFMRLDVIFAVTLHVRIVVASFMRPDEAFVMMLHKLDESSNYSNRTITEIGRPHLWGRKQQ